MPLGKAFKETVRDQLQSSPGYRRAYLREGIGCMIAGDKLVLRDYINGTIGFIALGEALGRDSKTLMRMLGPQGNPTVRNYFEIVAYLQKLEGGTLEVVYKAAA